MSDTILQLLALLLVPISFLLIFLPLLGPIASLGIAGLFVSGDLWLIGREINIRNQEKAQVTALRAEMTGWSANERLEE